MTLRATNAITSDAYIQIKRTASQLKQNTDQFILDVAATDTDYGRLETIYNTMINSYNQMQPMGATVGLQAYAQDQEDDPLYDFDTEFAAMQAAILACANWISTGIPITNRTLKAITDWPTASTIVADFFTPAQMTGLGNQLDAVTQSIS